MLASVEIPQSWADTSVVRHLDAPYSDTALAEARKTWIELGSVDLSDFPHSGTTVSSCWQIKKKGADLDISKQPNVTHELHYRFARAARLILGNEVFMESLISFDHFTAELSKHKSHTFTEPHLDGDFPGMSRHFSFLGPDYKGTELKLLGTAVNVLPTLIWQGPVERDDFYPDLDKSSIVLPSVVETGRLVPDEIQLNTLLIMAPSTIHSGPIADSDIGRRHFIRWQLHV